MTRLAITLALVALGVAIPVGLLVQRGIESESLRTDMKHQALAARTFDEMERALSLFLEREEERPFEAYAEDILGDQREHPFVVGYFEIDPNGSLELTHLRDAAEESIARSVVTSAFAQRRHRIAARADLPSDRLGASAPSEEQRGLAVEHSKLLELEARLEVAQPARPAPRRDAASRSSRDPAELILSPPEASPTSAAASGAALAPGKTQAVRTKEKPPRVAEDAGDSPTYSEYSLLDSLNQGLRQRDSRQKKVYVAPQAELPERVADELKGALSDASKPESSATAWDAAATGRRGESAEAVVPQRTVADTEAFSQTARVEALAKSKGATARKERKADDEVAGAEFFAVTGESPTMHEGWLQAAEELAAEEGTDGGKSESDADLARMAPTATRPAIPSPPAQQPRIPAATPPTLEAKNSTEADAPSTEAEPTLRITLDPMAGQAAGTEHLVLYRAAIVGSLGYHQGLLLDLPELGEWLERGVLRASRLDRVADLTFLLGGDQVPESSHAYLYEHRFGEPFDALRLSLAMPELPGESQVATLYGLAALLAIVCTLGLLAVYRMTSVVVQFAERRSNFVAAVTHELKTPLTSIRMYSEMLRDGLVRGEEKKAEYYHTLTDEAERLSRLIGNVLEFSKLEQGTRTLDWMVGDLGTVVRDAAETLRPHARSEGFEIDLAIEAGLPPVRFDRDVVIQLVFNLADNAMKYARHASHRRVVLACESSGGGVVMSVRDFGPGVSPGRLRRIFEPFYRGEDELTRNTKGTGIGLALVKQLAEAMNGRVWGDNAEGGGFRVSIELAQGPSPAQ